jgi:hypothetical protein
MENKNIPFKFEKWKPNTKPVPKSKKPIDHCAPVADNDRFVNIQDRDMDMIERRGDEILKKIKKYNTKLTKLGKIRKLGRSNTPRPVIVKMKQIMFPITIQRPEKEDHIIDGIIVPFDANFFGMPLAGYDPIRDKYAVDEGQQRLLALRDRIRLGLEPDCKPEDWEDYEVCLQVIDLEVKNGVVDYSPLRLRFIIENDRKLKVSDFDKLKNEVHGKLTDSPNSPTLPEYEKAAERYLKLKKKGLTPVDSTDEGEANKSGAFGAVRYIRNNKLTNEDIDNITDFFYDYFRHEPMYDIQVLPVQWLHKQNKEYHWYDNKDTKKVAEFERFKFCLNATCAVKNDFGEWMYFARDVWARRMKRLKSNDKIPDDFSMILLIQMTAKAGYTYPGIDPSWYTSYTDGVSSWDILRQEEKDLFV